MVRGRAVMAALNAALKNSVCGISINMADETMTIKFVNNYTLTWSGEDIGSDEMYTACLLLYDLPLRE